jgi:hypothetical protein
MDFAYLPEENDDVYVPVEDVPPLTREECMEMGICYSCSDTFRSALDEGGLCSYCDEDKWMRKHLGIPDDACWWEERYFPSPEGMKSVVICGISPGCLCRGMIVTDDMDFLGPSWEKDSWPGGTCSQTIRDEKDRCAREQINKLQEYLMSPEFKESVRLRREANEKEANESN